MDATIPPSQTSGQTSGRTSAGVPVDSALEVAVPGSRGVLTGRKVFAMFCAFFGVIFTANAALVVAANGTWPGMETWSAYRAGQLYNSEAAAARAADARGWSLMLAAERQANGAARLVARAADRGGAALAARDLVGTLRRPLQQREDRALTFREEAPGLYVAHAEGVASGQWDLVVDVTEAGERTLRRQVRVVLP